MSQNEIATSDDEDATLEAIRQREGFETLEQTIEWLAKASIRDSARRITGRGRALYAVGGKSKLCE